MDNHPNATRALLAMDETAKNMDFKVVGESVRILEKPVSVAAEPAWWFSSRLHWSGLDGVSPYRKQDIVVACA
jgi:hypothetical protein